MKEEQIKKFGDMVKEFCGGMQSFCDKFSKEFAEVTGDPAPEAATEDEVKVTEEVPTPAPVEDTPPVEGVPAEDAAFATVNEEEVNKDISSIKDAVDEVAESDVEESAETLKKTFSKLLKARDELFKLPSLKNFSEVKECCNKLYSDAENCKTYSARRKAKKLFDCIKFFADTVEEVIAESETPAEPVPATAPVEEPAPVNFDKCPKCGKNPCECESDKKEPEEKEFESAELDEAVESFTDKIPEDDPGLAEFCGNLVNFACVATSKEDADRKIRFLKAFSDVMEAPVAETVASKQDEIDPEVAEEMKKVEAAETKVTDTQIVEFSKLLRKSTGLSKEVVKSFSDLMKKFAEEEEKKEETPPAKEEEKPADENKEEAPAEEPKKEETPPPAEDENKEEAPAEDEDSDDEEVVIDKTEVTNFSRSSGDTYGDYMKKMLLR